MVLLDLRAVQDRGRAAPHQPQRKSAVLRGRGYSITGPGSEASCGRLEQQQLMATVAVDLSERPGDGKEAPQRPI